MADIQRRRPTRLTSSHVNRAGLRPGIFLGCGAADVFTIGHVVCDHQDAARLRPLIPAGGGMYGLKLVKHRRDDALARTDWADVERLLAAYYRRAGYDVEHCGTGGSRQQFDGGVDLRLRRGEEVILVQCKHWNK